VVCEGHKINESERFTWNFREAHRGRAVNLFSRLQHWRTQRQLRRRRIPAQLWRQVTETALGHYRLTARELQRLRNLASLFLQQKIINGAGGQEVDDTMRAVIAAQACLLILNLDLDWFGGWREIIVYPGSFVVDRIDHEDPGAAGLGVVHEQRAVLDGEAWGRGPVILAWDDARPDAHRHGEAFNVILHEFAHKLDMLNGTANGMPPLHPGMDQQRWTRVFTRAFDRLHAQIEQQQLGSIDPYGAEDPGEFFAVATEAFFQTPRQLYRECPDVYTQLAQFYRQDPRQRGTGCDYPDGDSSDAG